MRDDWEAEMTKFWGVRVGPGGQYAEAARKGGFVAIEWHELGDLTWYATAPDEDPAWEKLFGLYTDAYEVSGVRASVGAGQVARFARDIKVGDVILTPNTPQGLVYVGRVTSPFLFVESPKDGCPYRQRRKVEWLLDVPRKGLPQPLLNSLGSLSTVYSLQKAADYVRALLGEGSLSEGPKPVEADVVSHVLNRLHALHPKDFEQFVADYLRSIGFEAAPGPYVSDGGIDVAGTLDAEGLASVFLRIQVKRTKNDVGIEVVLKTRGALGVDEQGAIVSLGGFTSHAEKEAVAPGKKRITLVGGDTFAANLLARWDDLDPAMRKLLGVAPKASLPVQERFAVVSD